MPVLLVLLFVGLPLLEIVVVLQVGAAIGGWPTAALVVGFSIVGAVLLRVEGRRAWHDFRTALAEGRWPGDEVAQGALIIVGGTLLVTPGFVTDLIGFILLIGPTRSLVAGGVRRRVVATGAAGADPSAAGPFGGGSFGQGMQDRRRGGGEPSRRPAGDARRSARDADGPAADELEIEVVEIRREQDDPRD